MIKTRKKRTTVPARLLAAQRDHIAQHNSPAPMSVLAAVVGVRRDYCCVLARRMVAEGLWAQRQGSALYWPLP